LNQVPHLQPMSHSGDEPPPDKQWGVPGVDWWWTSSCDICHAELKENHWKCRDCTEDFDLCDACALRNWSNKTHTMKHTFERKVINQEETDANLNGCAEKMSTRQLRLEIEKVKAEIERIQKYLSRDPKLPDFDEEEYEIATFVIPEHCIPIRADVRFYDFQKLAETINEFDVIMMDPPWCLAGPAPTRGVALGYKQLRDQEIRDIPIPILQKNGFLFIWVINSRYNFALELFEEWGYTFADDITWVKCTVNRRLAKGHGYYLQHAKETCLVGYKGTPKNVKHNVGSDVLFSQRRGQSQKPEEIYDLIEKLVPNGRYLEIFARRNNLRNYWVSIGVEL